MKQKPKSILNLISISFFLPLLDSVMNDKQVISKEYWVQEPNVVIPKVGYLRSNKNKGACGLIGQITEASKSGSGF